MKIAIAANGDPNVRSGLPGLLMHDSRAADALRAHPRALVPRYATRCALHRRAGTLGRLKRGCGEAPKARMAHSASRGRGRRGSAAAQGAQAGQARCGTRGGASGRVRLTLKVRPARPTRPTPLDRPLRNFTEFPEDDQTQVESVTSLPGHMIFFQTLGQGGGPGGPGGPREVAASRSILRGCRVRHRLLLAGIAVLALVPRAVRARRRTLRARPARPTRPTHLDQLPKKITEFPEDDQTQVGRCEV